MSPYVTHGIERPPRLGYGIFGNFHHTFSSPVHMSQPEESMIVDMYLPSLCYTYATIQPEQQQKRRIRFPSVREQERMTDTRHPIAHSQYQQWIQSWRARALQIFLVCIILGGGFWYVAVSRTATPSWWQPGTHELPWQWELNHELMLSSADDAGTKSRTFTGAAAIHPTVYDIDGFNNSASDVARIHASGAKAICYVEVGATENYRPDFSSFPQSVLGKEVQRYPDERYLNIHIPAVLDLIKARILMCHTKGFDAVEPDIDDSYIADTGFSISETNEVQYLSKLSDYTHSLGMAWGLKNGGDGGTPSQFIADMLSHIDFAVIEEPYFLHTISSFSPTLSTAGKALFVAEYTNDTSDAASFCPQALADHANAALFDVDLDGQTRVACQ